ncbi:MAG: redoxin family protein [Bacteroidales bacterium]|nr:redoxin family protein [Bacteroidales bacterium]
MNIKRLSLLFLFLTQWLFVFGIKPVVIEGQASFAKGNQLRFYFYNDLLLKEKVLCSTVNVNKEGSFRVEIPTNETVLLTIAYNTTYGYIFIEPEKHYQIALSTDEERLKRIDAEILGGVIATRIIPVDTAELNYKINLFDKYFSCFLYQYTSYIYQGIQENVYDSLIGLLTKKFPVDDEAIDYYSVYVKYSIAGIDLLYYHKEKDKLYRKYLDSRYIFYNNIAYMDFFDSFFEGYLYTGTRKISHQILYENININRDYYKFLDEMGKDPVLVNERIREMVFIKGLGELYELGNEFNRNNILYLLSQMHSVSKFEEHRIMSNNQIKYLTRLRTQTKAPDFVLKDVYNSSVSLSDFKGRYLYLHFFSTYCEDCIREMLILKSVHEKYKDSLQVVSIMVDFEQANLYHFVNSHKEFNWTFLHFGGNYSFIDAYSVYGLPLGILIDSYGKIVSYPAKSPNHGLLAQLFAIFPMLETPKQANRNRY